MKDSSVQFTPSKFALVAEAAAGKRPDSRRVRDEKQPEAAEKSKAANAPGANAGSRSATEEMKSSRAVGWTRGRGTSAARVNSESLI